MMRNILLGTTLVLLVTCRPAPDQKPVPKNYRLVTNELGIAVEQFDSTVTDPGRYNRNNRIFNEGVSFEYEYQYLDSSGNPWFFKMEDGNWSFVKPENRLAIKRLTIRVWPETSFNEYPQTRIAYMLEGQQMFSMTGVIENEANLWAHPPREALFRILELNPFPHVEYPLEVGHTWTWSMEIGDHWADERWLVWNGAIANQYRYEITGREEVDTNWGELTCYRIEARAESRLGKTSLISLFHEEFGFLELHYINIDGSRIHFKLIGKSDRDSRDL